MWVIGVTVGALYYSVLPKAPAETIPAETESSKNQEFRTDYLAVAIFDSGNVSGYFTTRVKGKQLAEFDRDRLRSMLTDALHRAIYSGDDLDPKAPLAANVKAIAAEVENTINTRAGQPLVGDLQLTDITFLTHH